MKIQEFCTYNQQDVLTDEKLTLEVLEKIFGQSEKIVDKKGLEYSFGSVIGYVQEIFKDEKNQDIVKMVLLDQNFNEFSWDGRPVLFSRRAKTSAYKIMDLNRYYTQSLFYNGQEVFTRKADECEVMPKSSQKPKIEILKEQLESQGYHCDIKILAQFLLALDTNQMIILHGAPGMGKTSLVSHLAKALGYEYKIIPVRPNWMDNQDLTGYFNPVEHRYYSTPFLDALCQAKENPEKNYFICLDEMNLAHVEYYFSDILSAMESKEAIPLYAKKDWENALKRLEVLLENQDEKSITYLDAKIDYDNLTKRYTPEFQLSENVTFIGTLNMDATTNDLSPKVIDRSCIIKVAQDTQEALVDYEKGSLSEEEMRGKDSFESQLLHALNKKISNRVENQRMRMIKRCENEYLKGILSNQDFQDFFLAMKVLPALNVEDVSCILDADHFQVGDFMIDSENIDWKEKYPLTVAYLKEMCDSEMNILNYWKM